MAFNRIGVAFVGVVSPTLSGACNFEKLAAVLQHTVISIKAGIGNRDVIFFMKIQRIRLTVEVGIDIRGVEVILPAGVRCRARDFVAGLVKKAELETRHGLFAGILHAVLVGVKPHEVAYFDRRGAT